MLGVFRQPHSGFIVFSFCGPCFIFRSDLKYVRFLCGIAGIQCAQANSLSWKKAKLWAMFNAQQNTGEHLSLVTGE